MESSLAAVQTVQPLNARHPQHERRHRFHHHRIGNGCLQCSASCGKIGRFVRNISICNIERIAIALDVGMGELVEDSPRKS